jgi:cytidylate kinase
MMGIITISRGSFTTGKDIAERTALQLGYECTSREDLINASKKFNLEEIKLLSAIEDAPSILDRFTHGKHKYLVYIQAALLDYLKRDNIVYHGFAGQFFVKEVPHVLKIRITAELEDRLHILMDREKISHKEAQNLLRKIDDQRRKWCLKLYGTDPADSRLYDLVIHIDRLTVEDAVAIISQAAGLERFQTTAESKEALEDIALAAEVKTRLLDFKPTIGVTAQKGIVDVEVESSLPQDSDLFDKMTEIANSVPGIKSFNLVAGEASREGHLGRRDKSTGNFSRTFFSELG